MPKSIAPIVRIHDVSTGETIERVMTVDEVAERDRLELERLQSLEQIKEHEIKRTAVLQALALAAGLEVSEVLEVLG